MAGALESSVTHTINPKFPFPVTVSVTSPISVLIPGRLVRNPHNLALRCSSEGTGNDGLKNALSNIVDKRVGELLKKEENKELLDRLNKASERVEMARRELAEIERQEIEARQMRDYINQLESRASEIAECQKEVLEARAMMEEAERSLSMDMEGTGSRDDAVIRIVEVDRDIERLESLKAAAVSALVGTLAGLPIFLAKASSSSELLLQLAITSASCALFGVTFRYAVRRDLDNFQLKTGTSAAFGVVKGLATVSGGLLLEPNATSFISHALDGAFFVGQDALIFLFAGVSLDFCFKMRVLSPFPIQRLDASTKNR